MTDASWRRLGCLIVLLACGLWAALIAALSGGAR